MRKSKHKPARKRAQNQLHKAQEARALPFIAHLQELRRRLFYIALSIGAFMGLAYSVQEHLTKILLKPSGGQQFIYTTPGGGFDFQFKLCLYTAIAASIPVIIFQLFRYIHPLLKHESRRFLRWSVFVSSLLALTGILFGYFFGLPPALHFLLQSFSSERIEALISIQSYMSFVTIYLLGCALIFQLPLILLFINRIKPLQPKTLMKGQRWFLTGAVVAGAIISPAPDVRNLLMISGPIILMYELSIAMIWLVNRKHRRPKKALDLMRKDAEIQATRLANFEKARARLPNPQATPLIKSAAKAAPVYSPMAQTSRPLLPRSLPARSRRYVQDLAPSRRPYNYEGLRPNV